MLIDLSCALCSCSRLGLTSVGYLWRREQVDLLQDMVDASMESIIVKVASIGLNPRRHLGKTIGMLQYDFLRLVSRASGCEGFQ